MIKTFTIVAALLAGGVSLAIAQSGPPTGGYPSVAGGAAGNPGFIEYKMPSGQTVKLRTTKVHGKMHVLVPMSMSCDVFHVNC
jgi:hypothetical protein